MKSNFFFLSGALLLCRAAAEIPANLVTEGIPALPRELVADSSHYLESRTAAFLGWHPQRTEMLSLTRFADTPQLHLVRQPGGARRQLTFGSGTFRPVTGDCLIYSQDTGGSEFHQLDRFNPPDGRSTLLPDGKSRNTGTRWSRDGTRLAWTSTRRNGKDNDVWVMDPDKPAGARLLTENTGGGWYITDAFSTIAQSF